MGKVKTKDSAIETARRVLDTESSAVRSLIDKLDDNFSRAVDIIYDATGKVVVTGMGKSGIICQKIASTLASTGTPSFFLHPAEGVHGDLGM
ncbi:MAG: SIS domain-containing protein, partial [Thermodesulfobacteriota bacterium]